MPCEEAMDAIMEAEAELEEAFSDYKEQEEWAWAREENIKSECSGQSGNYTGTEKWEEGSVGACLGNIVYDWMNQDDLEEARSRFDDAESAIVEALMEYEGCLAECPPWSEGAWV